MADGGHFVPTLGSVPSMIGAATSHDGISPLSGRDHDMFVGVVRDRCLGSSWVFPHEIFVCGGGYHQTSLHLHPRVVPSGPPTVAKSLGVTNPWDWTAMQAACHCFDDDLAAFAAPICGVLTLLCGEILGADVVVAFIVGILSLLDHPHI